MRENNEIDWGWGHVDWSFGFYVIKRQNCGGGVKIRNDGK